MKKNIPFILSLVLVLISHCLYAHHHHVSNIPGAMADFTTIQAAHDANSVGAGDTIYLEPSGISYGDLAWSKKLIIIGNGYFLASNPETQYNTSPSKIGSITVLDRYTDNCVVTGCEINSISITKNTELIYIVRNLIGSIDFPEPDPDSACHVNYIFQNYISSLNCGHTENLEVENNYILNLNSWNQSNNLLIRNNVITGSVNVYNADFRNNIISGTSVNVSGSSVVYNNICAGSPFGTTNGNQANVNMEDVFVCWSNCSFHSSDGRFQLKPGSVAAGAGYGGTDCGMFGGDHSYIISGIPSVPAIYYLNAHPVGDVMNVRVKVKARN